tara:strand:+ start:110 stop:967 length:858 start_codon:yes stop_codon:yes gene_type:complete
MDKDKRIQHLETVINDSFHYISKHFHSFYWHRSNDSQEERDKHFENIYSSQLTIEIQNLYRYITCYFEILELRSYLDDFKSQFKKKVESGDNLDDFFPCVPVGIDGFEEDFEILEEFRRHLYSFPFFGDGYDKSKDDDYLKLKRVLSETKNIIEYSNITINKESDIINLVFKFVTFYFSESIVFPKKSRSRFIGQFQKYEADILIPELKTAIEYKYIKKSSKSIDKYIDEIYSDSTNYKGDYLYDTFIAVICLGNGISETQDRIKKCWYKKGFPKNWELIIVQNI